MKQKLLAALLFAVWLSVAQADVTQFELTGLVNIPGSKGAFLTFSRESNQPHSHPVHERFFLAEGERRGQISLLQIDIEKGSASFEINQTKTDLILSPDSKGNVEQQPDGPVTLKLHTGLGEAVDLYALLTKRTILRPALPMLTIDVVSSAKSQSEVASVLVKALKEKGISIIPDGEKFALAVQNQEAPRELKHIEMIKAAAAKSGAGKLNSPADVEIMWPSTSVHLVLEFYAKLVGATYHWPNPESPVPEITLNLKTQTPLTREEAIYAVDTVLRLNYLKVVLTENKKIKVIPVTTD